MTEFVIVLTTIPASLDALAMARTLVDERLAACVNIFPPMTSVFRWQGSVDTAEERQLVVKTTRGQVERLERRILELHPYDVPEMLVLPVDGGAPLYMDWLRASTDPHAG